MITQGVSVPGSAALTFDLEHWHGPIGDTTRWEIWEAGVPKVVTAVNWLDFRIIVQNGTGATVDRIRYTQAVPPLRFYPNHTLGSFNYTGPWV